MSGGISRPNLSVAYEGYIYQDILGAYFVAQELANGKGTTRFHFDYKKTPHEVPDKFDDIAIYKEDRAYYIQIKYSNEEHRRALTKQDFSSNSRCGLALFDLFETWKQLHRSGCEWRICLAWDDPLPNDEIRTVLIKLPDKESYLPGTTCFRFDCDVLWSENGNVLSSWRSLKERSNAIDRREFKAFLDCLIIEVGCPKTSLLKDYNQGLDKLLAYTIERIGIGQYPNDHLNVRQVAESLCTIVMRNRATDHSKPISCDKIAREITLEQSHGGIEQRFIIDEKVLVSTPDRVELVISALNEHHAVVLTAEPGAGKSWFIENIQNHLGDETQVIKHYCYIALDDPLALRRITVNVLYGSLIAQILNYNEDLGCHTTQRYASNLEQLNILLGKIEKKTLLIIDGIDHIWRVYQKNRGGLTEDETKILQAIAQLDYSNANVSLLAISQPVNQLSQLNSFYHCELPPVPENFVNELLEKHSVPNTVIDDISLAKVIHDKSKGNTLYCKYLIDHVIVNKSHSSFEWIDDLPPYDYNLKAYYRYLYEQIQGDTRVPYALCGAEFSVTEKDIQEITHIGDSASTQLALLKPILKYIPAIGYSIYHESFKRFVRDTIKENKGSIEHLIYCPLIKWLRTLDFFQSMKAYGHLLKLYYEVDDYDKIIKTISVSFIEKSLYNAQPFHLICQNHDLQKASLRYVDDFTPMLTIAEQSKIIYDLEHNITGEVLISYLKAVKKIYGDEAMYRVLWNKERLFVSNSDALRVLVSQIYEGTEIIHWSMVPYITYEFHERDEILRLLTVKHLHTKQYERLDTFIREIYEDEEHGKAFYKILEELVWWCVNFGNDWINETPYFQNILESLKPSVSTLEQAVDCIISNANFEFDDHWMLKLRDVRMFAKTANDEERDTVIDTLSGYNWFRNWLIYLIKLAEFSQRDYKDEELIDAFSYLVRDLEPFRRKPRTCDLHRQRSYIRRSFQKGLLLCKGKEETLVRCCELLERITETTTHFQGLYNGPLIHEDYLEIITSYLPGEYVIKKYEEYYVLIVSDRLYPEIAELAFKYSCILSDAEKNDEARKKYTEGIQALTAYGFRKDRTFSEILDCSVPYQIAYGSLDVQWFYNLHEMALTVVAHTDGKSTNSYPIEWFEEFVKVYPNEALRFLISKTLENSQARWYQEDGFYHILKECASLFSPTQWFLLCKSLPLASSDEILTYGLTIIDQIDESLQDVYKRWLQQLPFIKVDKDSSYSQETISQYEELFSISLELKKEESNSTDNSSASTIKQITQHSIKFPKTSVNEALAFIETYGVDIYVAPYLRELISTITDFEDKKRILYQLAKSLRFESQIGKWVDDLLNPESPEWLCFNVCLFVFVMDGWYHGLHYTHYLKRAYAAAPAQTISMLKEVLGDALSDNRHTGLISCNLIKALSELKFEEAEVNQLLLTTFDIVKRRLPYPPSNSKINPSLYEGLEGFNRDELVVALLIARLKTLTTEKTQGIIWSLTYIARTAPQTLFRPCYWAFTNHRHLLPVHRAMLLQILKEYVDQSLIPDELIGLLVNNYPTGFFLEDQYIRSFVDYSIELDEKSAKYIQYPKDERDNGFFPYIHIKYSTLDKYFGLIGTYKAYSYRRDKLGREHSSYSLRGEQIVTPIVSLGNATYEIVNSQYYGLLKKLTYFDPSNVCGLRFYLEEIIIQVGALTKRPSYLPTPTNFPSYEVRDTCNYRDESGWVLIASIEKEWYGEQSDPKKNSTSSVILTQEKNKTSKSKLFAKRLFFVDRYENEYLCNEPFDNPICFLNIYDTLERSCIVYVSPFIIKELNLATNLFLHEGFHACNDNNEVIIKMVTWKEDYFGDVSGGTEVPRLEGTAVMIRSDYYQRLLKLYNEEVFFHYRTESN